MSKYFVVSCGLFFGFVIAAAAASGQTPAAESPTGSSTSPALGQPQQAKPSSNGVLLGRPVSGRAPRATADTTKVPDTTQADEASAAAPEPVRQASYNNPPALVPPPVAPTPEPAAPEVLRTAPKPALKRPKPVTAAKPASYQSPTAKPAAYQSPGPGYSEQLPPAAHEVTEPGPDGAVVSDDPSAAVGPGVNGGCCGWLDYPSGIRGPLGQWWISADYLRWKVRGFQTPPLVTAGPLADPRGGILGDPATRVLYGGNISNNWQNGFRLGIGYWCDECQTLGIEANVLYLVEQITKFTAGPTPGTFIGRPFFDVAPGLQGEAAEEVSGLNLNGTVTVKLSTKLLGAEVNGRANLWADVLSNGWSYHVDGLAGFRYLQLQESLSIVENLTLLVPAGQLNAGDGIGLIDEFKTRNNFYGGQIGLDGELRCGRWFLDTRVKVALGVTHQMVNIDGSTMFFQPQGNLVATQPGGLLALPTNMGGHTRTAFSVVPEVGLNLGYQLTDHFRIYAGYTFLFWTHVARPGQQIDRTINSNQLPTITGPGSLGGGPARPMLMIQDTNFWAQGVSLGAELTW